MASVSRDISLFREAMAAESAKRENKKARTAAIANAVAGVPYAAERRLKLKLVMLGMKPRDAPAADDLRTEAAWNITIADLTDRRNARELTLRERWDSLPVASRPKGQYAPKNSLSMATGEQMEMLDMLDIEYDPNDAISVYDAQQMFNSSPRVHGVSLSTATQLFFTFRIPIDEFIGQDGDACYATLQRLIATRKVEAAEGIAAAAEEAYEAPARPPPAPRSSAAPAPKPPVPNGRGAAGRR